ncbi:MAG: sensor domain-containing diguanylate cyclase [Alphaproteobacteria bacterium]|nr:sensor domain-containing diguanylate cyclase [Alphaproteobacteria bacterium]
MKKPAPEPAPTPLAKAAAPVGKKEHQLPDFRNLVEEAVEGVLIHSNFKPLYANKALAQLFGYKKPEELLALPILRPLIPKDFWARAEHEYDDLIKGRVPGITGRMLLQRKDGSEFWLAGTQRRIDWYGTPAVQVTGFDTTAQMEVEKTLLRNEQRLRAMLEILPYPIYITRISDGQILFVNRKMCLLFQTGARHLLRSSSVDFFVCPQEREELLKLMETLGDVRDIEVRMRTGTGPTNREFMAEVAAINIDYDGVPAVLVAINDISQRKELEAELFKQASTDSLTGVSNRRYFMAQAEQELRRSRRFARDMSVMMVDLDHFKKVNDEHGHAAGDAVLQSFVKRALESLRQSDQLGRLGGEEFAVILPETNLVAAMDAAERLRRHLEERPLVADLMAIPCTVSIGVAQLNAVDGTIDQLLHRADEALYRAKNGGRNCVEVAETPPV